MPELGAVRKDVLQRLHAAGVDEHEAQREVIMILEHATGHRLAMQHLHADQQLAPDSLEKIERIVVQREKRVPLQYCLGEAWFMGLRFAVEPGVLIPRADTEKLVEVALQVLGGLAAPVFADIGCGSGAIAISILKSLPESKVFAIDISPVALRVTEQNADAHRVTDRLKLVGGDWLTFTPDRPLSAVISNPPYIPRRQALELQPEVAVFEPEEALFGEDADGLRFYRQLGEHAWQLLRPNGLMALEVGQGQAEAVVALLESGPWKNVTSHADLNGIPRVVTAFRADPSC